MSSSEMFKCDVDLIGGIYNHIRTKIPQKLNAKFKK